MFTGIIQSIGTVIKKEQKKDKFRLTVSSDMSGMLKVDESVAHNGVCLTVVSKTPESHTVDVIAETLKKTNLGLLKTGHIINLEKSLKLTDLLSGHLVQGHVDTCSVVKNINNSPNNTEIWVELKKKHAPLVIPQGSICMNGISLTVSELKKDAFKVSIIPYTFKHTNIRDLTKGDHVNIEFDIMGKYLLRWKEIKLQKD